MENFIFFAVLFTLLALLNNQLFKNEDIFLYYPFVDNAPVYFNASQCSTVLASID